MFKTQEDQEAKIRAELEALTLEINKLQKAIDETEPSSWLLKELCKAKENLEFQRNSKVNLLNTMKRW